MKKLLKYLNHYKKESVLGPFFKLLEAGFELIVPLVVANIIDIGIRHTDFFYVLKSGGILILLGVMGFVFAVTAQFFAAKAAAGFGTELRNDLFRHIHSFSYTTLDQIGAATLIARITGDVNQVQSCVNMVLRLFLRSPFIVFGAMVMAFTVNQKAALIFAVVIPILMILVLLIIRMTIPLYKRVQNSLDQILLKVRENLNGVRVIRAFNRQQAEDAQFRKESGSLLQTQLFAGRISALMNPLTYIIINGAIILVIWVGGKEVEGGVITQGAVVALVNYMSQILVELIKFANLIVSTTKALACANRIQEVLEKKEALSDGPSMANHENYVLPKASERIPSVEFKNVSFSYQNAGKEALEEIAFQAMKGESIGIIGSTGSGKSTLINLIPRFYDATSGEVRMNGKDVSTYPKAQLRAAIGLVPQKTVLFSGTIRDNLCFGKEDANDAEMTEALAAAQALTFVNEKKEKLDTLIEQGGKNLSGGQKQRLAIARALVRKPEILILDDCSSALDFATDAALRKALRTISDTMTVFTVSQRVASVRHADKIIVMEEGRIAGIGTHKELLKTCFVYREICHSQLSNEEVGVYA